MRYGSGGVQLNSSKDFWDKVKKGAANECWPWLEGVWHNGYGRFKHNYKSWRAHRFVMHDLGIEPPDPVLDKVLHTCHNRLCCNPNHLYWGNHSLNMQDRVARKLPAWNKGLIGGTAA